MPLIFVELRSQVLLSCYFHNDELNFGVSNIGTVGGWRRSSSQEKTWCHIAAVYSDLGKKFDFTFCTLGGQEEKQKHTLVYQFTDGGFIVQAIRVGGRFRRTQGHESSEEVLPSSSFADLRLWSGARQDKDIQEYRQMVLIGNEPGLHGYWRLDEGEGNFFYDSSLNSNNEGKIVGNCRWEPRSGLTLAVDNLMSDEAIKSLEEILISNLDKELKVLRSEAEAEECKRSSKELEKNQQLQQQQAELDRQQKDIDSEKTKVIDTMKKEEASGMRLSKFLEHLQNDIAASREQIKQVSDNLVGLNRVALDIKMALGYGGAELHLPDPERKTEPGRLSTLKVRFKAREIEKQTKPEEKPVPQLKDCTESFARRKVAAAGFLVEVVYQVVENPEQHGRVLEQHYHEKKKPGYKELERTIVLVIGQTRQQSGARTVL